MTHRALAPQDAVFRLQGVIVNNEILLPNVAQRLGFVFRL